MTNHQLARDVEAALAPVIHYDVHYKMSETRRACAVADADPMYGIGWQAGGNFPYVADRECPACRAWVDKHWPHPNHR